MPYLWVKGAAQIIPQLQSFVSFVDPGFSLHNVTIEEARILYHVEENIEDIRKFGHILHTKGSDKSIFYQAFNRYYVYMLKDLGGFDKSLRYLEIGMGTNNPKLVSTMGEHGRPGASLRAFAQMLPNAEIFGADVDRDILFEEPRIKTTYVDGYNLSTYDDLYHTFGSKKFDFILDDAAHSVASQFNTIIFALDHINVPGWIVIEDLDGEENMESYRILDFMLRQRAKNMNGVKLTTMWIRTAKRRLGGPGEGSFSHIYTISLHPADA